MSVGGGGKRSSGVSARRGKMVGRSKVWRLASFVDERRSEVECSLCPVRIKYVGNTTNIARHLELRHPVEFAALDPSNAGAGRSSGLGRQHPHRPQQHNREEAAICRILAQHREELKKQSCSVSGEQQQPAAASSCLVSAQRWTWHTPVQGEYCRSHAAVRGTHAIFIVCRHRQKGWNFLNTCFFYTSSRVAYRCGEDVTAATSVTC